jgi:ABC-2 type transport system permease protein
MPTADLATTPPAARPAPAFAQFPTAWRFALRNQARNRLAGLLLLLFVPTWYLLMAAITTHQPLHFKLFATGQPPCGVTSPSAWPGPPPSPPRA